MASSATDKATARPRRKRRRLQFGLPTLLGLVTLSAIVLGLIVNRAERQRRAVAAVRSLGGLVYYEDDKPFAAGPLFSLRKWLAPDYVVNAIVVYLDNSQVSNGALEDLKGMTGLQVLGLTNTQISDTGLGHLKGLPKLSRLELIDCHISDAALQHLKGLTAIRALLLDNTEVSDAGVKNLSGLTGLRTLYLYNTKVSDTGLEHLKALTGLRTLYLYNIPLSDAALADLRAALPGCIIYCLGRDGRYH